MIPWALKSKAPTQVVAGRSVRLETLEDTHPKAAAVLSNGRVIFRPGLLRDPHKEVTGEPQSCYHRVSISHSISNEIWGRTKEGDQQVASALS